MTSHAITPEPTPAREAKAPVIRHLSIERFRGITKLSWHPGRGVNVILGGGDVGKTTILEAIGLLLSPTNPANIPDTDYHAREIEAGFIIEAVISLPPDSGINDQVKPSWPWQWNGTQAMVPAIDGEGATPSDPVYRLRVRGTEDRNSPTRLSSRTAQLTASPSGFAGRLALSGLAAMTAAIAISVWSRDPTKQYLGEEPEDDET